MAGLTTKQLFPAGTPYGVRHAAALFLVTVLCGSAFSNAQVFTVQREKLAPKDANLTTVQPTAVQLSTTPITERTRQQLVRTFQADEAFAVRPLPLGTKGGVLHANGPLNPAGSAYADELQKFGISSKPGDKGVITKFVVLKDRILFEFNDGPEKHHHILQHISVGGMGGDVPLARDD